MRHALVSSVVVVAMSVAPAFARTGSTKAAPTRTPDQRFVTIAAEHNMAEIEIGQLAATKASSPNVKSFAKRMVDDHQKALDSLKMIAMKDNITLPTTIGSRDRALKARLDKRSGKAFDRAYMRAMVRDHRGDVAAFRAESQHATNADIKQYAASTLPTLEEQLKLAESTDQSVIGTSGKSGSKKSVG
jgi:putative membrane protein